jgi:hypothetical protein
MASKAAGRYEMTDRAHHTRGLTQVALAERAGVNVS